MSAAALAAFRFAAALCFLEVAVSLGFFTRLSLGPARMAPRPMLVAQSARFSALARLVFILAAALASGGEMAAIASSLKSEAAPSLASRAVSASRRSPSALYNALHRSRRFTILNLLFSIYRIFRQ